MLTGVYISVIAACYAVALALEVSRLFFRLPVRLAAIVGFTLAGMIALTVHLVLRASLELRELGAGTPLSNWYDWCLMVAWLLAAVYLIDLLRRPRASIGLFMLPAVLALVGLAWLVRHAQPAAVEQAQSIWTTVHVLALLMGTAMVILGFVICVMYLVQSWRLKRKLRPRPGFKLPSLEWLQRTSERALISSCALLASGVLAGVVLNLIHGQQGEAALPWKDPGVVTSSLLLLWVVVAGVFNVVYRPARQGRKIAYLTLANFGFLVLVLGLLLFGPSQHSSQAAPPPAESGLEQPKQAVAAAVPSMATSSRAAGGRQ
jgi:ABC-type transport system involved in cytochrome c biogenesis permease subunit